MGGPAQVSGGGRHNLRCRLCRRQLGWRPGAPAPGPRDGPNDPFSPSHLVASLVLLGALLLGYVAVPLAALPLLLAGLLQLPAPSVASPIVTRAALRCAALRASRAGACACSQRALVECRVGLEFAELGKKPPAAAGPAAGSPLLRRLDPHVLHEPLESRRVGDLRQNAYLRL